MSKSKTIKLKVLCLLWVEFALCSLKKSFIRCVVPLALNACIHQLDIFSKWSFEVTNLFM
jgi:hypothetical protein